MAASSLLLNDAQQWAIAAIEADTAGLSPLAGEKELLMTMVRNNDAEILSLFAELRAADGVDVGGVDSRSDAAQTTAAVRHRLAAALRHHVDAVGEAYSHQGSVHA